VHCPYCNADLLEGRELKCSASGALFSQDVSDTFRKRYGQDRTVSSSPGRSWRYDWKLVLSRVRGADAGPPFSGVWARV
jgi:hypothetical protein